MSGRPRRREALLAAACWLGLAALAPPAAAQGLAEPDAPGISACVNVAPLAGSFGAAAVCVAALHLARERGWSRERGRDRSVLRAWKQSGLERDPLEVARKLVELDTFTWGLHAETDFYWHFVGGRASIDPWLDLDSLNCWELVLLCAWIANRPGFEHASSLALIDAYTLDHPTAFLHERLQRWDWKTPIPAGHIVYIAPREGGIGFDHVGIALGGYSMIDLGPCKNRVAVSAIWWLGYPHEVYHAPLRRNE